MFYKFKIHEIIILIIIKSNAYLNAANWHIAHRMLSTYNLKIIYFNSCCQRVLSCKPHINKQYLQQLHL